MHYRCKVYIQNRSTRLAEMQTWTKADAQTELSVLYSFDNTINISFTLRINPYKTIPSKY